jgi:F420-dependent oxidoreductase-like protein
VRYGKPLGRTREYVEIVRKALARETVRYEGEHYTLPLPDGPGKALKLSFRPHRTDIPIYLAAVGPKNLELAGEIADGWLAIFFDPGLGEQLLAPIVKGRAKVGRDMGSFDVVPSVPVVFGDDPEMCAELVRWYAALYIGGMGSREKNFYNELATRMGYGEAAHEIQELYLSGHQREAAAAVPFDFIDRTSLLGPVDRVAARMREYAQAGVTTLAVSMFAGDAQTGRETLRSVAEAHELSGTGD